MRPATTRILAAVAFATIATPAAAQPVQRHPAHMTDPLAAKLDARIRATETRIAAARKADRISAAKATGLSGKVASIRTDAARNVKAQGFLSAGESASYNRTLDGIEALLD